MRRPSFRPFRFPALAALLLLAAVSACRREGGGGIAITVEPDGTNVAQGLLSAIEGAQVAVHVEMYLFTSDVYVQALAAAEARGVDVKVVLNQRFPSTPSTAEPNATTFAALSAAGVGVRWAPTDTGFGEYTHEKAVLIDPGAPGEQAWIMTMNLDDDAMQYNREYLALDTVAADVAEAEAIFQADYAGTEIVAAGGLVVAPSPQNDAQPALLSLLASATTSLDLEAEELDGSGLASPLLDALTAKAGAGVRVRLVLEDSSYAAQREAVQALVAAGGEVVGYAYAEGALDIHAKALVVDGARAYVGSENFSGGSLGYNRELGVVFTEASEVAKVRATIAADFEGGAPYDGE